NGGGNTPANEGGATTGETPADPNKADPNKADPNKAPKTGESNAFVLSMLGIIAVAGMGLYVGKRQEN
ncbi:MAG: LPXTG cell wall anchor domain-containing protein, partial [Clostridia bacterium]|nr:LPXTG cell wall anchor domain-containing protein [Clostridia bacterium]